MKTTTTQPFRRLAATIFAGFCAAALLAVPAKRQWTTVKQSDGTEIKVMLMGDERMHFYINEDSIVVEMQANGDFVPISLPDSSTPVKATEYANARRKAASPRRNSSHTRQLSPARKAAMSDGAEKHCLVILVNFSDRKLSGDAPFTSWNNILNLEGYAENNAKGSVHDYFVAQSDGQFSPVFDVYGPVDMTKASTYYGKNTTALDDAYVDEMVAEAISAIKDTADFGLYDWDGDGYVDQVVLLYAGFGENVTGNSASLIWPHEWKLSEFSTQYPNGISVGSKTIDCYAVISEYGNSERAAIPTLSGLGTFCHEFSHCMGLPDLYPNTTTTSFNDYLSGYDLMSDGNYNGNGWIPCGYTAYEKMYCGWKTPIELTQPATIDSLKTTADGGDAYIVRHETASDEADEYFLIENRQRSGWDEKIPGSGLTIMHIDYDESVWEANEVNSVKSHQRVAIVAANNNVNADRYWPYPYKGYMKTASSFTDDTTPAATCFNTGTNGTKKLGKPITDIAVTDGLASFKFMGGSETGISNAVAEQSIMGQPATIYDIAGKRVLTVKSYNGLNGLLRSGLYLVKAKGLTMKVAVK